MFCSADLDLKGFQIPVNVDCTKSQDSVVASREQLCLGDILVNDHNCCLVH